MKALAAVAVTLAIVGCGTRGDGPCTVDTDVVGMGVLDPVTTSSPESLTLRVGQAVRVCMFGTHSCMYADQRFEFQSDAPGVVAAAHASASLAECNELFSNYSYPCCAVAVGRLTAVSAGTAHVEAVLFRGGSVEKTAGLMWCPPYGPGSGCRPIAAVVVTP